MLQPAPAVRFTLNAFRITGATIFAEPELQRLLEEYIGREVGMPDLGEAVGRLTRFYFDRGYPLATAYLPVQDIKDGVVEIAIIEGRFGNVRLLNRSRVRDAVVSSYFQNLPGHIVEQASLERKLLLVHDLPGVAPVKAVLYPGEATGETNLRLELAPGRAVAGGVELDNYGNRYTGGIRVSGQLDVFSAVGLGDRLSARATKGEPGLEYGRIGYQLPLGGEGLQLGVAYSRAEYRLGKDFTALGASGDANTWSAFASYPLVRSRRFNLHGRAGYERKALQDRVGATATVADKSSDFATVALSGDYVDALGAGVASAFLLSYGRGTLNIETLAAKAIDDATIRTDGGFHKWNLYFAWRQNLTEAVSVFVSFNGQKAGKNLDSSEKLILGGAGGVRAYPQGEAPGDTGYVLSGEVGYAFSAGMLPGVLQLVAFIETGEVELNEEPFGAGPNRRRLSGGGVGLNWGRANDFAFRLALAHRIGNARATAGSDRPSRGWLQAIKYF